MHLRKTREPNCLFVHLGVVFHRARAERINAQVYAVIFLREACEMPHDIHFAHFGQAQFVTYQIARQFGLGTSQSGSE